MTKQSSSIEGSFWRRNPDAAATLENLWLQGYPTRYIAAKLSSYRGEVGHHAVIGKAHRMGLPPHENATNSGKRKKPKEEKKPKRRRLYLLPEKVTGIPKMDDTKEDLTHMVSLLDAKNNQCRWVIGNPSEMMFCGAPVNEDSRIPYCPHHAMRAVNTIAPKGKFTTPRPPSRHW